MKKTIIFISFIVVCMLGKAQSNLPYKSLSELNNDTTTFIIYNFSERAESYKNKTLEDIYQNLQIPIKYITKSTKNLSIERLYIYLSDNSTSDPIYICWEKEEDMNIDLREFERNSYEKYKNKRIKEIGVILSNNKKLKSSEEIPRGYIKNGRMVYRWKTGR